MALFDYSSKNGFYLNDGTFVPYDQTDPLTGQSLWQGEIQNAATANIDNVFGARGTDPAAWQRLVNFVQGSGLPEDQILAKLRGFQTANQQDMIASDARTNLTESLMMAAAMAGVGGLAYAGAGLGAAGEGVLGGIGGVGGEGVLGLGTNELAAGLGSSELAGGGGVFLPDAYNAFPSGTGSFDMGGSAGVFDSPFATGAETSWGTNHGWTPDQTAYGDWRGIEGFTGAQGTGGGVQWGTQVPNLVNAPATFSAADAAMSGIGNAWESSAAASSLQNAALAEASGQVAAGTLARTVGTEAAKSLLSGAQSVLAGGDSKSWGDSILDFLKTPTGMSVAGNLLGAGIGALGSYAASRAQQQSATDALNLQRYMYDTSRSDLAPWRDAGTAALGRIQELTGLKSGGAPFTADPGYQWRIQQGEQAINRSMTPRQSFDSGATLKALLNYGQNAASAEYDKVLNRQFRLAGLGQDSTSQGVNLNQNFGNNAANTMMNAGNARASGYMGMANSIGAGVGNIANILGQYNLRNYP